MNGETTKYRYYEASSQSIVTIPVSIARSLGWENGDEIFIKMEVLGKEKGLFLFKKENA